jgi:hypothetical protein
MSAFVTEMNELFSTLPEKEAYGFQYHCDLEDQLLDFGRCLSRGHVIHNASRKVSKDPQNLLVYHTGPVESPIRTYIMASNVQCETP